MGYRDFDLDTLRHEFGITVRDQALFDSIGELVPSAWLRETLQAGSGPARVSVKARGEFIVAPILMECREIRQRKINIFSGVRFDADPEKGLDGECDFLLAQSPSKYYMQNPRMPIVVAKKHDVDDALGECAAQMLGICRYNERFGMSAKCVYGCVTNGDLWHVLKLHSSVLVFHPHRVEIDDVSKLLWFLVQCLKDLDQQTSEAA